MSTVMQANFNSVLSDINDHPQFERLSGTGEIVVKRVLFWHALAAAAKALASLLFVPAQGLGDCKVEVNGYFDGYEEGCYPAFFNPDGSGIAFVGRATVKNQMNSRVLQLVGIDADGNEAALLAEVATPGVGYSMATYALERKDGELFCSVRGKAYPLDGVLATGDPGLYVKGKAGTHNYKVTA